MDVGRGQKFSFNVLPRIDFHIVILVVGDNKLALHFVSTTIAVPVLISTCNEYHGGCTVNGESTKSLLFTVSITVWNQTQA